MSRLLLAALACSTAAAELVVVQPFGSPVPRQFLLLSDGVDCRGDCPAVVLLHGFSENPYLLSKSIGFEPLLKGRGWIGAVPFGLSPNNRTGPAACCDVGCDAACCEAGQHLAQNESAQCDWNTDRQTSGAWPAAADDTAFLSFLARYLVGKGADEKRIFATGMSAGAMMAQRLGCDAAAAYGAVAPVEGDLMDNSTCAPTPAKQVPWLGFCGSLDFVCQSMGTSFKATTTDWAQRNGCDMARPFTSKRVSNTTTCHSYVGCAQAVEACTVAGMGHKWPGHNEPEQKVPQNKGNVDASKYIFEFFDRVSSSLA